MRLTTEPHPALGFVFPRLQATGQWSGLEISEQSQGIHLVFLDILQPVLLDTQNTKPTPWTRSLWAIGFVPETPETLVVLMRFGQDRLKLSVIIQPAVSRLPDMVWVHRASVTVLFGELMCTSDTVPEVVYGQNYSVLGERGIGVSVCRPE